MSANLVLMVVWAGSLVVAFRIGHFAGWCLGMWGPSAWLRMNAAHAASFERGKTVGIALGKQQRD